MSAAIVGSLCACGVTNISGTFETYDRPDTYTVGDGQATDISALDVSWVAGDIKIEYAEQDYISFSETASEDYGEDYRMRWKVEYGTLDIHFVKSGVSSKNNYSKTLTVKLPASLTLSDLEIESVSSDVTCTVDARKADIETVSGDATMQNVLVSSEFDFDSVSGNLTATFRTAPAVMDLETTSGNVDVGLPQDANFTLTFSTVSGTIQSLHPNAVLQNKTVTCGTGANRYRLKTVSGNCTVR